MLGQVPRAHLVEQRKHRAQRCIIVRVAEKHLEKSRVLRRKRSGRISYSIERRTISVKGLDLRHGCTNIRSSRLCDIRFNGNNRFFRRKVGRRGTRHSNYASRQIEENVRIIIFIVFPTSKWCHSPTQQQPFLLQPYQYLSYTTIAARTDLIILLQGGHSAF